MRNFPLKYSNVTTFYRNFVAKIARKEIFCYLCLTDWRAHQYKIE